MLTYHQWGQLTGHLNAFSYEILAIKFSLKIISLNFHPNLAGCLVKAGSYLASQHLCVVLSSPASMPSLSWPWTLTSPCGWPHAAQLVCVLPYHGWAFCDCGCQRLVGLPRSPWLSVPYMLPPDSSGQAHPVESYMSSYPRYVSPMPQVGPNPSVAEAPKPAQVPADSQGLYPQGKCWLRTTAPAV